MSEQSTPDAQAWVDDLFDVMLSCYGSKFLDMWADTNLDSVKRTWARAVSRLHPNELMRGLEALYAIDKPPTLPQFLRLCRPSLDATNAYYEAIAGLQARQKGEVGIWTHPAIFHASKGLYSDLLSLPYSSIKARWEKALADELAKGTWEPIPEPLLALPVPPPPSHQDRAAYKRAMQEICVMLQRGADFDHMRWAKRIMARIEQNDTTLSRVQIKFAEIATTKKPDEF